MVVDVRGKGNAGGGIRREWFTNVRPGPHRASFPAHLFTAYRVVSLSTVGVATVSC